MATEITSVCLTSEQRLTFQGRKAASFVQYTNVILVDYILRDPTQYSHYPDLTVMVWGQISGQVFLFCFVCLFVCLFFFCFLIILSSICFDLIYIPVPAAEMCEKRRLAKM